MAKYTTEQIYGLVNDVAGQALGKNNITVVDTSTLVSLGNEVLSSSAYTEAFLNTLVMRIGRTIISFREYRNKLGDMVLNDFEYGAILQKISVLMPEAIEDPSWELENGQSIDHYKISKPEALQKFFYTRTPYMFKVTIQDAHLKEAFSDSSKMASFIAAVFGEVRNAIEFALENLGRSCLNNFIAETSHVYNLVTMFNTEMGLTGNNALNATTAMHSDLFLNFAIGRINHHAKMITEMSVRYNDGSKPRFTPVDKRVIRLLSDFDTRAQTVTQYAAYHDRYVSVGGVWDTISYWQDFKEGDEAKVSVKRKSDGTNKTINNVIGVIYDRDALGIYKKEERVATTPVNAAGLYYNTFYHERQLWFNDLQENFVVFTLN